MAASEGGVFRVLVVEDNPHVSEIFKYAFRRIVHERLGEAVKVEVDGAGDGHQAWSLLEASAGTPRGYDLVILDLMLPVLDGGAVLSRARGHDGLRDLPIVVITAGDDDACRDAKARGATEVLRKPVQFAQIREVVSALI